MPMPSSMNAISIVSLAADVVGHPAEERSREAVQHAVDRQREAERRQRQAEDADRDVARS